MLGDNKKMQINKSSLRCLNIKKKRIKQKQMLRLDELEFVSCFYLELICLVMKFFEFYFCGILPHIFELTRIFVRPSES